MKKSAQKTFVPLRAALETPLAKNQQAGARMAGVAAPRIGLALTTDIYGAAIIVLAFISRLALRAGGRALA